MNSTAQPLRVLVLTSGPCGLMAAASIARLPFVRETTVLTAPALRRRHSMMGKARRMWRLDGPRGVLRAAARRLRAPRLMPAAERFAQMASTHCPDVPHAYVGDFHAPDTLQRVRAMAPDLGVIVATHRLVPGLFTLPRLGSINLHFGNAPEYRGSSPGFWELYDGTPEVGLTIHWVSEQLDAGDIILQERLPLDLVPPGDPLVYLADLWRDQLLPNGVRLLVDAVDRLSRGPVAARQQDAARARTRSFATWRDKRELRRRVAARRAGPAALRS